jgi:hypothetical protein
LAPVESHRASREDHSTPDRTKDAQDQRGLRTGHHFPFGLNIARRKKERRRLKREASRGSATVAPLVARHPDRMASPSSCPRSKGLGQRAPEADAGLLDSGPSLPLPPARVHGVGEADIGGHHEEFGMALCPRPQTWLTGLMVNVTSVFRRSDECIAAPSPKGRVNGPPDAP